MPMLCKTTPSPPITAPLCAWVLRPLVTHILVVRVAHIACVVTSSTNPLYAPCSWSSATSIAPRGSKFDPTLKDQSLILCNFLNANTPLSTLQNSPLICPRHKQCVHKLQPSPVCKYLSNASLASTPGCWWHRAARTASAQFVCQFLHQLLVRLVLLVRICSRLTRTFHSFCNTFDGQCCCATS